MSRHGGLTQADREYIEGQGGVIMDTRDGYAVDFPAQEQAEPPVQHVDAKAIEAAVARAAEYGTHVVPVWRSRGEGWYVAESHAEHPGWWYLCQIDARNGQPVGCECVSSYLCHHLGAAISVWREQVNYEANGATVAAEWEATRARVRADAPSEMKEEAWV